jgi:hypothetical protein
MNTRAGRIKEALEFFRVEVQLDYELARLGKPYVVVMEGITSSCPFLLILSCRLSECFKSLLLLYSGRRGRSSIPSSDQDRNVHDQLCNARNSYRVRSGCWSFVLPSPT